MKKAILLFLIGVTAQFGIAQTASNFNCADCSSNNHDLFTELNSNKVIVIAWVMPCVNCISGALSAFTAVQSYSASNPGQVRFYLSDDVGNTTCPTLQSWASTNGMTPDAIFSNALVSMTPYGVAGMPKVIVVGGNSHTVYYNTNGSGNINTAGVQGGINNALSAIAAGIKENNGVFSSLGVYPNPTNSSASVSLKLSKESKVKIEVENLFGQKMLEVYNGDLSQGDNSIKINTSELANGNYFISCSDGNTTKKIKFIVVR
jgi:hypothetical protein